jgi:hypothetical protein
LASGRERERGRWAGGVDWAKPGHVKELGCRKKRGKRGGWLGLKEENRVGLEKEKEKEIRGWF